MTFTEVAASVFYEPLAAGDMAGLAGWQWILICLVAIVIVALLLAYSATFSARSPYLESLSAHGEGDHSAGEPHDGRAAAEIQLSPADDLKLIEGIGPKIEALLKGQGVETFTQLANSDAAWLREVLLAAGMRVNDPTTWPEQARLAASGDWTAFEALKASLKGGRKA